MAGRMAGRHCQRALRLASSGCLSSPQPAPALSGSGISGQPCRYLPPTSSPSAPMLPMRQYVCALSSQVSVPRSRTAEPSDVYEYNRLISHLAFKNMANLNRTVYEDMLLDGVQPILDTFFLLMNGCMKGSRLQDVMYFFEEMKAMGLTPDAACFHCVITACGKSLQVDRAFQIAEEMVATGIQPKHRTFLALLRSCAIAGRVDEAYGVARRMAAGGLSLSKNFYVALILAHKNKQPLAEDAVPKIFELLEQSKQQSREDLMAVAATGEFENHADIDDELAVMLSNEVKPRRYFSRNLVVYRAAVITLNTIGDREAVKAVLKLIQTDGFEPDSFCVTQLIRCYLAEGNFEEACATYSAYVDTGKPPTLELYITLIEGSLNNYSPVSSAVAQKLLADLSKRGYFLNAQVGSTLLHRACRESSRDIVIANLVWDMMKNREGKVSKVVTQEYFKTLEMCNLSKDDPRYVEVKALVDKGRRVDFRIREAPAPSPLVQEVGRAGAPEVMEHQTPSEQVFTAASRELEVALNGEEAVIADSTSDTDDVSERLSASSERTDQQEIGR